MMVELNIPVDERIAYGAQCTWWGSIHKVGNNNGLPCCPRCKGLLFEMKDAKEWVNGIDMYDKTHQGYKSFAIWLEGKCYRGTASAKHAYEQETGKLVKL